MLADCHIDHGTHRLWADGAWEQACADIAAGGYVAAVVAGDLFHTGRPSAEALMRCVQGLRCMTRAGVRVVIVAGNHEWIGVRAALQHRPPTAVLDELPDVVAVTQPAGLHVCDGLWVAALPWPAASMAGQQPQHALRLAEQATHVDAARLAVGHAAIVEAVRWPGSEAELSAAPPAATAALADVDHPDVFERTLLGHFHTPRALSPTCGYVGGLECFTFADEGRVGGWVSLDRVGGGWVPTFVEAGKHRFETIDMDTDLAAVAAGTVVRVRVRAGQSRLDFDSGAVAKAGLRFAGFYDESVATAAASTLSRAPLEPTERSPADIVALLDRWAEQRRLTARDRSLLRRAADDLLGWAPAVTDAAAAA